MTADTFVVRDSRGRPCPLSLEVCTAGAPRPVGWTAYEMPDPEALAPTGESLYLEGGDFAPATLLRAYRAGYFPWPRSAEDELWWYSPNPRAILPVASFTVHQRLGRTVRSGRFRVTVDGAFGAVIRACAGRPQGTWITPNLMAGYLELARLGWAHSFEVWEGGKLVGGLYGLGLGGMFGAESMFSCVSDASKVAMVAMVQHCRTIGVELIDIQVLNDHTARMGGVEIPRRVYLERLRKVLTREARWFAHVNQAAGDC